MHAVVFVGARGQRERESGRETRGRVTICGYGGHERKGGGG